MTSNEVREKILSMMELLERDGTKDLVKFMKSSDYFTAPASIGFHSNKIGGLAEHSYLVTKVLGEKVLQYKKELEGAGYDNLNETVIICGLFHDMCKVNFYKEGGDPATHAQMKYLGSWYSPDNPISKKRASQLIEHFKKGGVVNNLPEGEVEWTVDDKFPIGHGEKSVIMLRDFIKLTVSEMLAIRWHMMMFDPSIHFKYPYGFAFAKAQEEPLVTLLATADLEATFVLEEKKVDK